MSYPPNPQNPPGPPNPYGQQPPQPGHTPPQQGYPQPQQGYVPPQQGYAPPQQGYGYPQQQPGYGYSPQGPGQGMPPFASWGARVGATLVDFLITGLVPMILVMVGYTQIVGAALDSINECTSISCPQPEVSSSAYVLLSIGVLLGFAGNMWLCYREGSTGQTPGKKALGITLLREADGRPLGFGLSFVRRLAHALDGMSCYIGYLWPLWDDKKQTFADKVMKTVVVKSQ